MWSSDATPLWVNDGLVAVTGLASGVANYWTNSPSGGGGFSATPVWHGPFRCEGADKLFLVWEGRIEAIGGITGNTSGNISLLGIGLPWWSSSRFTPQVISENVAFSTTDAATDVESNQAKALTLHFRGPHATEQTRQSGNDLAHIANHNFLPIGTSSVPANGDTGLWYSQFGLKPSGLAGATGVQDAVEFKTSGLQTFWLAVSHFSTITGTLATTRLSGQLSVIRVWENGTLHRA